MKRIRIATRRSALAVWQAEHVADLLRGAHPGLVVEVLPMSTRGDELADTPLAGFGGKGLFTQELERAILEQRAEVAVHSMKDVPAELPEGLCIASIVEREDPHDALVSNTFTSLDALPAGARLGTSSLRREFQLRRARPGLVILPLRGNVSTRLDKLDAGEYDAIILAVAGLRRLGLDARVAARLPARQCLPAIGQGAIGIECMAADAATLDCIRAIDHAPTHQCVAAERTVNRALHGSCESPVAAHARLEAGQLELTARVGLPDGSEMLESAAAGVPGDAVKVGEQAGRALLEQGAAELLARSGNAQ